MTLVEEAWCSSEYRFAVISNQYLDRNKFHIVLESKIPASEDLTKLTLQEIPEMPLTSGWYKTWDRSKISCHYWLLHINFGYFGLQTIGENMVYNQQCYMNR